MQGTSVTADYGADAEKLSGTVYWMLQDGQPSTRQLLSSSQAIVSSYLNDPYGNNISSSGSAANSFKWNGGSGYYSDAESGLQKVGARYYDPSVGSWISQDTILIAGSPADSQAVNRYLYCGANPVGRVDPVGHWPGGGEGDPIGVSGLIIGLAGFFSASDPIAYLGFTIAFVGFSITAAGVVVSLLLAVGALVCLGMLIASIWYGFSKTPQSNWGTSDNTVGAGRDGNDNQCNGWPGGYVTGVE